MDSEKTALHYDPPRSTCTREMPYLVYPHLVLVRPAGQRPAVLAWGEADVRSWKASWTDDDER